MDFAHKNMKDFIKRKEDARSLGVELFQEVVSLSLEEYKAPPPDTTPVPPNSLHEDLGKLYASTKQVFLFFFFIFIIIIIFGHKLTSPLPSQSDTTDAYVNIGGDKICFHRFSFSFPPPPSFPPSLSSSLLPPLLSLLLLPLTSLSRAVLSAHTKPFANAIANAKDDDMTDALGVAGMEVEAFRSVCEICLFWQCGMFFFCVFENNMVLHIFQNRPPASFPFFSSFASFSLLSRILPPVLACDCAPFAKRDLRRLSCKESQRV